jgi:hypothetical protein
MVIWQSIVCKNLKYIFKVRTLNMYSNQTKQGKPNHTSDT